MENRRGLFTIETLGMKWSEIRRFRHNAGNNRRAADRYMAEMRGSGLSVAEKRKWVFLNLIIRNRVNYI